MDNFSERGENDYEVFDDEYDENTVYNELKHCGNCLECRLLGILTQEDETDCLLNSQLAIPSTCRLEAKRFKVKKLLEEITPQDGKKKRIRPSEEIRKNIYNEKFMTQVIHDNKRFNVIDFENRLIRCLLIRRKKLQ